MSGIRSYLKYLSISSSRAAFNFPNLFCASNFNFDTYNSLTPNWYYKVLR